MLGTVGSSGPRLPGGGVQKSRWMSLDGGKVLDSTEARVKGGRDGWPVNPSSGGSSSSSEQAGKAMMRMRRDGEGESSRSFAECDTPANPVQAW